MDLAIKAAEANAVVEIAEKNVLKAFASEMEIEPRYSSGIQLEELLESIAAITSSKNRKIMVFEIMGILISDSEFDEMEKNFVDKICSYLGIAKTEKDQMLSLIIQYSLLYKDICKTIFAD